MFQPLFPDMAGFFEAEWKVFSALKQAGLQAQNLFDVGSSTGGWTCMMSQVFTGAKFFLFDPLVGLKPNYDDGTERTLKAVPGSRFFKVALGDRNERRGILTDPRGFNSSLLLKSPTELFAEEIPIQVRRLDDLLRKERLPVPDILKIDVQGGELLVLKGLGDRLPEVKVVQAETWFTRGYGPETPVFSEIYQFLQPHGFVLMDFSERFYTDLHELICGDAIFLRREVLSSLSLPKGPLA
jgi:FkbM family methyltransferase